MTKIGAYITLIKNLTHNIYILKTEQRARDLSKIKPKEQFKIENPLFIT